MYERNFKLIGLLLTVILSFFLITTEVYAVCEKGEYSHLNDAGQIECKNPVKVDENGNRMDNVDKSISSIHSYLLTFSKALITLFMTVSVLMIVMAGYTYTMSEGNNRKMDEAKQWLYRAGIGILLLFMAFIFATVEYRLVGAEDDYLNGETNKTTNHKKVEEQTIVEVEEIDDVEIKIGEAYKLKEKAKVLYSDGIVKYIDIVWNDSDVDVSKEGNYKVIGEIKNIERTIEITIEVKEEKQPISDDVTIEFIDEIKDVTVPYGGNYELREQVLVKFSDGTEKILKIAWDDSMVDVEEPKAYIINGMIEEIEKLVTMKVTVEKDGYLFDNTFGVKQMEFPSIHEFKYIYRTFSDGADDKFTIVAPNFMRKHSKKLGDNLYYIKGAGGYLTTQPSQAGIKEMEKEMDIIKNYKIDNYSHLNGAMMIVYDARRKDGGAPGIAFNDRSVNINTGYRFRGKVINHELSHLWQFEHVGLDSSNNNETYRNYASGRGWEIVPQEKVKKWGDRLIEIVNEDIAKYFDENYRFNIQEHGETYNEQYTKNFVMGQMSNQKEVLNYIIITEGNYLNFVGDKLEEKYNTNKKLFETKYLKNNCKVLVLGIDEDGRYGSYSRWGGMIPKDSHIKIRYIDSGYVYFELRGIKLDGEIHYKDKSVYARALKDKFKKCIN